MYNHAVHAATQQAARTRMYESVLSLLAGVMLYRGMNDARTDIHCKKEMVILTLLSLFQLQLNDIMLLPH